MPVIIICASEAQCHKLKATMKAADLFIGENAGILVALLAQFRKRTNGLVITTISACLGADFVFAVPLAFVITLTLPATWLEL